jgi:hypothetical protein
MLLNVGIAARFAVAPGISTLPICCCAGDYGLGHIDLWPSLDDLQLRAMRAPDRLP